MHAPRRTCQLNKISWNEIILTNWNAMMIDDYQRMAAEFPNDPRMIHDPPPPAYNYPLITYLALEGGRQFTSERKEKIPSPPLIEMMKEEKKEDAVSYTRERNKRGWGWGAAAPRE